MKILTLVPHYLPGVKAGGSLQSVSNLVKSLNCDKLEFQIVCGDRDLGDSVPYAGVRRDQWNNISDVRIYYVSRSALGAARYIFAAIKSKSDLIYINSIFSLRFGIVPLLLCRIGIFRGRRILVAPRGQFSAGALKLSEKKKAIFLKFAMSLGIFKNVYWHASSSYERKDIIKNIHGSAGRIFCASDISFAGDGNSLEKKPRLDDGRLNIVFLSRISPMKNLDYALDVLSNVRAPVSFDIYGPTEDQAYADRCRQKCEELPNNIYITWHGAVEHTHVSRILGSADLFFLPTRGENFGHVIAEALGVGTPVLISDQTSWTDIQTEGVGAAFSLSDVQNFSGWIDQFANLSQEKATAMREKSLKYIRNRRNKRNDVEKNAKMFESVALDQKPGS